MESSKKDKIQAADRICRKLDMSLKELMELMERYNQRVYELNKITVKYANDFLLPKGRIVNGEYVYDINDDDKAILLAYRKKAEETLADEFPELEEIREDLKHFEDGIDPNMYL